MSRIKLLPDVSVLGQRRKSAAPMLSANCCILRGRQSPQPKSSDSNVIATSLVKLQPTSTLQRVGGGRGLVVHRRRELLLFGRHLRQLQRAKQCGRRAVGPRQRAAIVETRFSGASATFRRPSELCWRRRAGWVHLHGELQPI